MPDVLALTLDRIATPTGELVFAVDADGSLRALDWADNDDRLLRMLRRYYGAHGFTLEAAPEPHPVRRPLQRYFAGELAAIEDLPVQTTGTSFQRSVWQELRKIPHGDAISYTRLAARISRPTAIRAVGLANGSNPINIVVPCHRVIGADGSLTGYGGGLDRKRWLLRHEQQHSVACSR